MEVKSIIIMKQALVNGILKQLNAIIVEQMWKLWIMDNKKELENLRELVKECIKEQEKIGLHPAKNIEVQFGQDPITKHRPNTSSDAISVF